MTTVAGNENNKSENKENEVVRMVTISDRNIRPEVIVTTVSSTGHGCGKRGLILPGWLGGGFGASCNI